MCVHREFKIWSTIRKRCTIIVFVYPIPLVSNCQVLSIQDSCMPHSSVTNPRQYETREVEEPILYSFDKVWIYVYYTKVRKCYDMNPELHDAYGRYTLRHHTCSQVSLWYEWVYGQIKLIDDWIWKYHIIAHEFHCSMMDIATRTGSVVSIIDLLF